MGNHNKDERRFTVPDQPSDFINDRHVDQVGGEHYQSDYQHWDWVAEQGLDYFQGNATKYISRWDKKGLIGDLEKAVSYIKKLILLQREGYCDNQCIPLGHEFAKFCQVNDVTGDELQICMQITTWNEEEDLDEVVTNLEYLIANAQGHASV